MCYSAQIRADYKQFFRLFGGVLTLRAFGELYYERQGNPRSSIVVETVVGPSPAATGPRRWRRTVHTQPEVRGANEGVGMAARSDDGETNLRKHSLAWPRALQVSHLGRQRPPNDRVRARRGFV